jgi:hypothetical protein
MSVETTLLNAKSPVAHFHKYFLKHIIQPIQEMHRQMQIENERKEGFIIKQLDAARAREWIKRDLKWGWLSAA